ncbi:MAG: ferritin-like domain-containing protein [Myxococcales bacterium]|nr:ferritin-like domain-containing protein [Myxococcales bacterium]
MRDRRDLRARLYVALALGLSGCDDGKGTAAPGVGPGAGPPERSEGEAGGSVGAGGPSNGKGGVGRVVDQIRASADGEDGAGEGEADGAGDDGAGEGGHHAAVDPVPYCGTPQLSVTVKDADAGRFGPADELGCAVSTAPVGVSGMANFTLDRANTQALRDAGNTEHCCYQIMRPPRGRPLVTGGRTLLPTFEVGPRRAAPGLRDPRVARRVAAAWLHDARLEWASVASFERAAEELRRLGAPPALCRAHRRAADDERRHTAACLRWAERAAGRSLGLGELPPAAPRPGDRLACLRRTFVEGCMAETAAALVAVRSARRAPDDVADTLRTIADDEAEHAALAWTTIGWGLARVTAAERQAFIAWARRQRPGPARPGPDPDARHGRLSAASERAIAVEAWVHCVEPLLRRLERVGGRASAAGEVTRGRGGSPRRLRTPPPALRADR